MEISQELITRCKSSDHNAIKELYQLYQRYLYSICFSYTQHEQDSLDLVQEVFLKVYYNLSSFRDGMPFHPWIRRICVNACLNFKRGQRTNVISLHAAHRDEPAIEDTLASATSINDEIEKMELKNVITDGLSSLSADARMILVLRYYDDLSYQEISDLLHKPLGTVKTELYRAKALLKHRLQEKGVFYHDMQTR